MKDMMAAEHGELTFLASLTNLKGITGVELTASVGGAIIKGTLTSPKEYFKSLSSKVSKKYKKKEEISEPLSGFLSAYGKTWSGAIEKFRENIDDYKFDTETTVTSYTTDYLYMTDAEIISSASTDTSKKKMMISLQVSKIEWFSLA